MKLAATTIILFLAAVHTALGCEFSQSSTNSAIEDGALSCLSVKEASLLGLSTCTFNVSGAESVVLTGFLAQYNDAVLSEDKTLLDIVMKKTYTDIVDTATPNVVPEGILTCIDADSVSTDYSLIIKIFEENTQPPVFDRPSYIFDGVPETFPLYADFTTLGYGPPIYTSDNDNSEEGEHSSNIIYYSFEDSFGIFQVIAISENHDEGNNHTYPRLYRASISVKNSLNYTVQSSYTLNLIAVNEDPPFSVSVEVIINVKDIDNLNPVFTSPLYTGTVTPDMLTHIGPYEVSTEPPIHAYDQDTGINATLVYSIDYNCGDTEECLIVTENFALEPIDGTLIFRNDVGIWDHTIPQITFTIMATQVDNPERVAYSTVTVYFDFPPTVPSGLNKCFYIGADDNSVVDDANRHLYCTSHEYTDLRLFVCEFLVTGALSVSLSGLLKDYNALPSVNTGNGSLIMSLYNTAPYSDIVDRDHPNVNPAGTVTCVDVDGVSADVAITVRVIQENTQYPIFEHLSYTFLDVHEDLPPGIDFTTYIYGDPIFVTDSDNNDLDPIASNLIEFEVDNTYPDLFQVQSILDRTTFPKRFRAAISLKKNFDPNIRIYQFQLYANNSVPNVKGDQVIATTVNVELNK